MSRMPAPMDANLSDEEEEFSGDDETYPLTNDIYGGSQRSSPETKGWDVFRSLPPESESGSTANQQCMELTVRILKVFAYLITFVVVLLSGIVSKGTVLFMTSQVKLNRTIAYCSKDIKRGKDMEATLPELETIAWIWCLFFAFIVPEVFMWFRSCRICFFKSSRKPPFLDFIIVTFFETCHVIGVALLMFVVLPEFNVVQGAMLTNCVCLIPGIFGLLSRSNKESRRLGKSVMDIVAILAQISGCLLWPLLLGYKQPSLWAVPFALGLTSFGWWENYVDKQSPLVVIKYLGRVKERLKRNRYFTYFFISIWKVLVFLASMVTIVYCSTGRADILFANFAKSFETHKINVTEKAGPTSTQSDNFRPGLFQENELIDSWANTPLYVFIIQVFATWFCYIFGKFSCKICIQGFSFAFPVNLTIPVTISLLIAACGLRIGNTCAFDGVIPFYLYWECPSGDFLTDIILNQHSWVWLLWLLSQTWITLHIWTPKCERLASTEKLFVNPFYCSLLIDQSMGLNRRRDDESDVKTEELDHLPDKEGVTDADLTQYYETISNHTESSSTSPKAVKASDSITRIYSCATMWHETADEMMEMLKSIFRMDEDQSARRVAQKYLKIVDPDYYEFETHIFFDDAFEISDDNDDENVVNRFVKLLVNLMDEAASHVHQTNIRIRPPKKYPTPYGGRLVWTLPGKTKMIAHLKDKGKIRHRKRWSQVMYMYYLLGNKLMDLPISVDRKEVIAENTYLLTLDGDIDFQPNAVQLLVDLMKKNRNLGAACGRIHPVGSGPMVWYQMFEYAIGHWLQKATEHMIGCVLCSPGCFSLFRGKALMDDNVMRKYTTKSEEARHYVQYDQGEDRWLCTLLLQRGYRVEYSAASDAYTHCPEGFGEFYNQRRRWVPSTMANIMDLLMDYKRTIKINDNISLLYISYQTMLMGGTILGPGTIFLMLVGAFVAAFRIDNWSSFYYNIIPIFLFMFICFVAKADIQLLVAQILSAAYAMVMMAVIVGTALQLGEDGVGSPSAIFLIALSGSFFIAACLHPQEFWCVVPGMLYLLMIPSMYLLLILYSLINLNVVSWGTREVQTKKTKKIICAEILSAVYAMVMMAVLVGIILEIKEDGILAPSALFFFATAASFIITAALHPKEFYCLPCGLVYYLSVPSMYLLLIIYSIFNMNNVTWGTRESVVKKTKEEMEQEKKEQEEAAKKAKSNSLLGMLQRAGDKPDEEGSIEFSLANLFKCMLCTYPKPIDEKQQLMKIAEALETLNKRLDSIERCVDPHAALTGRRRSVSRASVKGVGEAAALASVHEDAEEEFPEEEESDEESLEPKQERDDLINPYWIEDKDLKRGEVDYLEGSEIQFWKDLLEKYLYPIDEDKAAQKRIAAELKELRDKFVFFFFMINALFVLIVFLLQLNKDSIHIQWPLGVKTNITYNEANSEVLISKEYLQLEPIGLVFVFFFALILIIQFVAMLFHRFGTLSHILSSTELTCCSKKVDDISEDAFIDKNAVEIVRNLQKLRGLDEGDNDSEDGSGQDRLARRRTIHNLEKQKQRKRAIGTLDVAFKKRFFSISAEAGVEETPVLSHMRKLSMRRETIKALEVRRNTIIGERKKSTMQTLGASNEFNKNGKSRHRNSTQISQNNVERIFSPNGHPNEGYEGSSDDDTSVKMQRFPQMNGRGSVTWKESDRRNSQM